MPKQLSHKINTETLWSGVVRLHPEVSYGNETHSALTMVCLSPAKHSRDQGVLETGRVSH